MYRLSKNTGLKIDFRGSYLHDSWANMNLIMQSLKFVSELVPLVLSGEKNCTWRLFNDKASLSQTLFMTKNIKLMK